MHCLNNLERLTTTKEMIVKIINLYQYKGKDFYYCDVLKQDLDQITKDTVERETFFLGKLINLDVTESRKRLIIKKDSKPKTHDEQILFNLKHIISFLQTKVVDFDLLSNEVLSLAKRLYQDVCEVKFNTFVEEVQVNLLREKKRVSKRDDLDKLLELYSKLLYAQEHELTNLVTNFYIDFINLKVFNEGNELISLMLIYILLFKERFNVFKYMSFFEELYNQKEMFKNAVIQAGFNWEHGFSQTTPLNIMIMDLMIVAYNKTDEVVRDYNFDAKLNKSDNIENTIMKLPQVFTKDEIRNKHPYTSESTINRTLQRLKDENKVRPNGVGRSATWIRLIEHEKFNPNFKQIDLFEIFDEENKR